MECHAQKLGSRLASKFGQAVSQVRGCGLFRQSSSPYPSIIDSKKLISFPRVKVRLVINETGEIIIIHNLENNREEKDYQQTE